MQRLFIVFLLVITLLGIFELNAQEPEWQIYNTSNSLIPSNEIFNFSRDNQNNIWLGTNSSGCAKFDGQTFEVYNTENGLSNDMVRATKIGPDSTLWVGTAWGLNHKTNNSWEYFLNHEVTVSNIQFSANGRMWVGTGTEGLYSYYQNVWTQYTTSNSQLPSNYVNDIEIINDNDIWVGCYNGGLVHIVNGIFTIYNSGNSDLGVNTVWDLYHHDNYLWVSTQTGGVYRLDLGTMNWTAYTTSNSGLPNNNVKSHLTIGNKEFFGTWGGGLAICEGNNWQIFNMSNSPLPDDNIGLRCFQLLENNYLAIGTNNGLAILNINIGDPWGNPEILQTNMTVISEIRIDNLPADDGDIVAAFEINDGQEVLRGKTTVNLNNGISSAIQMIYFANENSVIKFKIWDNSENVIYNCLETVQTQANGIIGSYPNELFLINGVLEQNIFELTSGWNLISFNCLSQNREIETVFADYLDFILLIKDDTSTFIYGYPDNTLSEFWIGNGYWVNMVSPQTIEVNGIHANNTIELTSGWNLIGYNLLNAQTVETALASIMDNVLEVKGVDGIYTPGNPMNSLTSLEPLKGYWIKVNNACTLVYTESDVAKLLMKNNRPNRQVIIKPNSFTVVAKVTHNGQNLAENSQLLAYSGQELRGEVNVHIINGHSLAYLQVFSDQVNEQITFKVIENGQTIQSIQTFTSQPGSIVGNYQNGDFYQIDATLKIYDNALAPLVEISSIYPNPFNPTTNIKYTLGMNQKVNVSIFNVKGQLIRTLVNETQDAGDHQVEWDGKTDKNENTGSGVYFCKVSGLLKTQTKKMIMMK